MIWNDEQSEAVRHMDGPCLVLAGPGSGKTAVITGRAAELVKNGVKPEQILVLTFTRAAAAEMRERYTALYPGDMFSGVVFSTFHALCFKILKREGLCGPDALVTAEEKRRTAEETVRKLADTSDPQERRRLARKILEADALRDRDAGQEDAGILPLAQHYRETLRAAGKIDFHDMVRGCLDLLESDAAALGRVRRVIRYVMVDEAQDMSRDQLRVAELLADPGANLFIVGDDDQSIYGFRGVSARNMAEAAARRKDTRVIRLSVNYRSVPAVTEAAGKLIRHNRERFRKSIRSSRPAAGGEAVRLRVFRNEYEEASEIAREIRLLRDDGVPLSEIGVLCRTSGQQRPILRAFAEMGIPCVCADDPVQGLRGLIRRDLKAFSGLAKDMRRAGTWNAGDLKHVLNIRGSGLYAAGAGEGAVDPAGWAECFRDDPALYRDAYSLIRDVRALARMDGEAFLSYIYRAMGYREHIMKLCGKSGTSEAQVLRLLRECAEQVRLRETGMARGTEIIDPKSHSGAAEDPPGVRLMTMHAAKGLEFQAVFLPTLNEGVIPHSSARSAEALEEERRLMYVAVTRAKDELRLSFVRTLHAHSPAPSRFLKEMLGSAAEL